MATTRSLIAEVIDKFIPHAGAIAHYEVRDRNLQPLLAAPDAGDFRYVDEMGFGKIGFVLVETADIDDARFPQYASRWCFESARGGVTVWFATLKDAIWLGDVLDDFAKLMYHAGSPG